MPLTLGLTGMDPATETSLKAAFAEANARLGGAWRLLPENEADHVVVDMDSMYGPMSWLRLHAAGKTVIGLTTAARAQTDIRLGQPFTSDSVAEMLQQIAGPAAPAATAEVPVARVAPQPAPAAVANAAPAEPIGTNNAAPTQAPIEPAPAVNEGPTLAEASRPRTLGEWLASGQLQGRVRLTRDDLALFIDNDQRQYHGPASLKPLANHFRDELGATDFEPISATEWNAAAAALGAAQPLARLVWLGALLAGKGSLAPGVDRDGRYQLLKWPQTEREYPKHFRIATVMMKGPSTLAEITAASGVMAEEVADFVNASLATGFAEPWREPELEPEQPKSSGLFGRLRGR